jgi:hypothetical protein
VHGKCDTNHAAFPHSIKNEVLEEETMKMKSLAVKFPKGTREREFITALSKWLVANNFQDMMQDGPGVKSNFQLAHNFIQDVRGLDPGEGKFGRAMVDHAGTDEFVVEIRRLPPGVASKLKPFQKGTFCIICPLPRPHCCAG